MRSWGILLAVGAVLASCDSKRTAPDPSPARGSAPVAATSVSPPASSPPAPQESEPPKPADLPRCKALEKKRLVGIGTRPISVASLIARDGDVYALGFQRQLARAELVRFPRDGAKPVELGRYKGFGEPQSLRLGRSTAFFCMKQTLVAIPLAGGTALVLAAEFSKIAAANEQHVYGVRCDKKEGLDELVRVKHAGGEVEVAASWPRNKSSAACDYKDIALDETSAYLASWAPRRLIAISLSGGELRELVKGPPYIGGLAVEPDGVVYNAQGGIFRLAKTGGEAKRLTELGGAPFSSFVWDSAALYVLQTEAYADREFVARVPREGGKAEELESFAVSDVTAGGGRSNIAADDSCVYFAQARDAYVEIMARPK